MKFDDDDLLIKKSLNTIDTPEYDIKQAVKKKMRGKGNYIHVKRAIPITLIACMMLVLSTGVAAAYIPSFNQLLSIVSPEIAVKLQPIEEMSEDNGIKMEVVAAMSDKDMAVIYLTMQDLTGDRIDETIDLYDSYSLTGAHISNSQIVDYDETTKTATFQIQTTGGENVDGKKMNFQVGSFLSNQQSFQELEVDVILADIKNERATTTVLDMDNSTSGGGGDFYQELYEQGEIKILETDVMNKMLPEIQSMYISNIGFVDNRLHIQTKWQDGNIDDHGDFYFVDHAGNRIHSATSSVTFGLNDLGETEYGQNMVEYIFDMDQLDVKTLKLVGDFVTNGKYITGNWDTTFKLKSVEEKTLAIKEEFKTWTATEMTISSLGVTLSGQGEGSEVAEPDVRIKMKDGSVQEFDAITSYRETEKVNMKFILDLPLALSQVQSVMINGVEITVGN